MPVARNVNLSKSSNIMKTVVFLVTLGIFKIEMCDKIFDNEVTFSVLNWIELSVDHLDIVVVQFKYPFSDVVEVSRITTLNKCLE